MTKSRVQIPLEINSLMTILHVLHKILNYPHFMRFIIFCFQFAARAFEFHRINKSISNVSSPSNTSLPLLRTSNITLPQKLKRVKDIGFNIFLFSAVVGNTSKTTIFDRVVINAWADRKYSNDTNFKCCLRYKSRRLVTLKLTSKINWAYMKYTKLQAKQYVCPNPRGRQGDRVVGITLAYNKTKCPMSGLWYVRPNYAFRHENEIAVCAKVFD